MMRFLPLLLLVSPSVWAQELPVAADRPVDFVKDIQPIFKAHCYSCHDGGKQRSGLRLDVKSAALKGGETFGAAIVPGKSASSPLIRLVAGLEEGLLMPPEGNRLSPEQIGLLRAWIDRGATWPDDASAGDDSATHWSFRPVQRPAVPGGSETWNRSPIDAFVLSRLQGDSSISQPDANPAKAIEPVIKLPPSPEADRRVLFRRLSFDLLGLPPESDEVHEFLVDDRPDAYERLVDRMLASPHFGERWARHWLDVVRFAESDGFETNQPRPNAWRYRDYVIRAFNEDVSYEQFLVDQLAGDATGVDEATGFIVGGAWDRVKSPDPGLTAQQRADELHDMVSTTGSTFLGLTVGCARCHNHKFDPISQVDYYSMKAAFAGVQHGERPIKPARAPQKDQEIARLQQEVSAIESALRRFEPLAFVPESGTTGTLLLDDDAAAPMNLSSSPTPAQVTVAPPSVTQLLPRIGLEPHRPGNGRGQAGDRGNPVRFPNLGRNYSYWNRIAGKDVFTWNPGLAGTFQVWLSWGCGWPTHASDARYVLDADGDLTTQDDQREIARVDQRRFADGTGGAEQQPLWSNFFHAGIHEFTPTTRLVLRGGDTDAYVTADLLCLQAVRPGDAPATTPRLRASVHRQSNIDRFGPVQARFIRFVIDQTNNGSEPCLDELEVYTTGPNSTNVAPRAKVTSSSNLPGYEIHQLRHVNDGRFGNGASWISNEPGRGWIQLEFETPVEVDRVVWSRDRLETGSFGDRIPVRYRIEAGPTAESLHVVATSEDRLPFDYKRPDLATRTGLAPQEQLEASQLAVRSDTLTAALRPLLETPLAYAGRFTAPETTYRFHRGDPLQPREQVAAAGLSSFPPELVLPSEASDLERRQRLADWMIDPSQPLTFRVLANRLWHFHFGQGLVTTPSDFGRNGARPSHPLLLDWLASEVTPARKDAGSERHSRSLKSLHRLIVTSATYRQSSQARPDGMQADAGSRLLWRFPPRRLEAEPLRDAILAVCGNLDDRMQGPGFDLFEPNTNYVKVYQSKRAFGPAEWRRMVYQSKPRMQLDETFGQFDCPDAGQIAPRRTSSITALQALGLLNSGFIVQQSNQFAERLTVEAGADPARQARRAFALVFLREPTSDELAGSLSLIQQHGLPAFCRALLNANEFLFVF